MFRHVHGISVYVHDQERALAFYTEVLGFETREDATFPEGGTMMRWLEVAPPGSQTILTLAKGYGGWSAERVGQMAPITLSVDDVRATVAAIRAKGAVITLEPVTNPWGSNAAFKDPDGNEYVLNGT